MLNRLAQSSARCRRVGPNRVKCRLPYPRLKQGREPGWFVVGGSGQGDLTGAVPPPPIGNALTIDPAQWAGGASQPAITPLKFHHDALGQFIPPPPPMPLGPAARPTYKSPASRTFTDTFQNKIIDNCWARNMLGTWGEANSAKGLLNATLGSVAPIGALLLHEYQYTDLDIEYTVNLLPSRNIGVIVRAQLNQSGYIVRCPAASIVLDRVDANVATNIGTVVGAYALNDRIRLRVVGNSLSVYQNDVLIIGPVVDANYATGYVGVFCNAVSQQLAKIVITPQ